MPETDLTRDGRVLRFRDAGDSGGTAVMYFHGTPGSRLDPCFGEQAAAGRGVRLVSFDRPGYGGSTPAAFGPEAIAHDVAAVADELGIDRFSTLGHSGGGPFALAAAAVLGDRVERVGVASGPGPFQLVPGALGDLDNNDTLANSLLPDDPAGAADGFAAGFEPLVPLFRDGSPTDIVAALGPQMSPRDRTLLMNDRFASALGTTMRESLRQGTTGAGWDNVSWVGAWDIDLSAISSPVFLWYGDEDRFVPLAHGHWLRDNIETATLVQRTGEGHLGFFEHFEEMLDALTTP